MKRISKNWTRVWMIIIVLIICTFIAFAAYTEVSAVKRVVSTTSSPGDPFSSNCMRTTLTSRKLITAQFPVSICNFDQDYPKNYSPVDITYTLTAELKVKVNNQYRTFAEMAQMVTAGTLTGELYNSYVTKASSYSIGKTTDDETGNVLSPDYYTLDSSNNYKKEFAADTLTANKSSTDFYTVIIPEGDLNSDDSLFFVFITAHPEGNVLHDLSARLYGMKEKEDEAASWTGTILESSLTTVDYDFYNYVITGSGVGSIDILWDARYIEVNKYFLEQQGLNNSVAEVAANDSEYGDSGTKAQRTGWKKITLSNVNPSITPRYEFQLFKVSEGSMNNPGDYIECYFTQSNG